MSFRPFLHRRFKLDGKSFANPKQLTDYVRTRYPEHEEFLCRWFDDSTHVRLHTSGSTGPAKVMEFPKKKLMLSALRTIRFFALPPGSSVLLNLSPVYVAGKMMWVRALTGGWNLRITDAGAPVPDTFFDFGAMVPRQAEKNRRALHRFKKLLLGGGPTGSPLESFLKTLPSAVFLTYGMTETLTHVAVMPLNGQAARCMRAEPGWFHALPAVRFRTDAENCLRISDAWLDLETAAQDKVWLRDSRTFKWKGRCDNIINTGGIKVSPEEIEKKLAPFISRRFVITSLPDPSWGEKIILIIEGEPPCIEAKIFDDAGLAFFEKPKEMYRIDSLPETPSGKIRRHAIDFGKLIPCSEIFRN